MLFASDYMGEDTSYVDKWDSMEHLHYQRWLEAKDDYAADVRNECEYRLKQIAHSCNQQEAIVRSQIQNAIDEKIKRMREAQLENLKKKYEDQKAMVEDTITKADIHTNLLVRGVLHMD